jgi:murein DD-endopeptidase / murein LD-carboxypeptidase
LRVTLDCEMKTMKRSIIGCLIILGCLNDACKHKEKQSHSTKKSVAGKQAPKTKKPSDQSAQNPGKANEVEQKLGVSKKQIHENKLYSFVDDWYGTPYKYGGCQKTGIDCSCFTNLLYDRVYGIKIARSAADMFLGCDKISIEDAHQGDLLFFKIGGSAITHVGVFLRSKLFVHASTSKGVSINSVDEAYYKKYF